MHPAFLVLGAIFAALGFREAKRHEEKFGHSPWGWPPAVWAVVCFLSAFLGALLLYFARKGEKREPVNPSVREGFGRRKAA